MHNRHPRSWQDGELPAPIATFNLDGSNGLYTLNGPNPCGTSGPVGETRFTFTPA